MLDFILDNWRLIIEGVLFVISFVFFIIRKKPIEIVEFTKTFITNSLLELIPLAECSDLSGHQKKEFVISRLVSICKENGFNLTERDLDFASSQIEYILSCPQKKGK